MIRIKYSEECIAGHGVDVDLNMMQQALSSPLPMERNFYWRTIIRSLKLTSIWYMINLGNYQGLDMVKFNVRGQSRCVPPLRMHSKAPWEVITWELVLNGCQG